LTSPSASTRTCRWRTSARPWRCSRSGWD